mgnify:CR=1 FL=1
MQKDSRKNEERLLPFETIKAAMEGDVDKNFAPKQNERDCPMTNGARKSSVYADFRALVM